MTSDTGSSTEYVRRGLLKIDDTTVLDAVDKLQLRGNSKVSAVVGMPLRTLQQRRDVSAFAVSAPIAAVQALLELLAMEPLERVIEELGDHADSPTYDQLSGAIDRLRASGASNDDVVALLTHAIGEEFPAAPHCRRLLEERPELQLPALPSVAPMSSLLVAKEIDPAVREQRRARHEAEKSLKKGKKSAESSRPPRPSKVKVPKATAPAAPQDRGNAEQMAPEFERRPMKLTPTEEVEFNTSHPLVGTVVLAEVPFDAEDASIPELKAKERPALVVAASDAAILVRGIYSNTGVTRVLFSPWRRLKLDHPSYVDVARTAVREVQMNEIVRLGRLTDLEWNQLL
ncbi:MAG TPA: hypothetical protein VII84_08530 [Acidimicrobiales bacterium]